MLTKVISGGQTGADRAGLFMAKAAGIQTGGWMPKGFLAQDGKHPEFAAEFCIEEHSSPKYPPRTAMNAKSSDGTMRFATNWDSAGEKLTLKMVHQYNKLVFDVDPNGGTTPQDAADWITQNNIKILNIAGNSERTSPGIGDFTIGFLAEMFEILLAGPPCNTDGEVP